jgi:hypothetical protein
MFSVVRSYWYQPEGLGNLRYTERAPEKPDAHAHQVCNCTRAVTEKPEGAPQSITQEVLWTREEKSLFEVQLGASWFTFRWNRKDNGSSGKWAFDPHVYFMFHKDAQKSFRIEVTAADDPQVKRAFFGSVFLGNKIDVSTLMNGHSSSRIVDLSKIGEDDLWVHNCHWGSEAMLTLLDGGSEEISTWKHIIRSTISLQQQVGKYVQDTETLVEDLRQHLVSELVAERIEELRRLLEPLAIGIRETQLYGACKKVENEAEAAHERKINAEEASRSAHLD